MKIELTPAETKAIIADHVKRVVGDRSQYKHFVARSTTYGHWLVECQTEEERQAALAEAQRAREHARPRADDDAELAVPAEDAAADF